MALDDAHGRYAVALRGRGLLVASQQADLDGVRSALADSMPLAATGIGSERRGLSGLLDSLTDAELALGLAEPGQVASFDQHWVWATLTRAAPRLQGHLHPGWEVAQHNPHLAETVTTFAASGFSLTEVPAAWTSIRTPRPTGSIAGRHSPGTMPGRSTD